jgi:hypothetical protein
MNDTNDLWMALIGVIGSLLLIFGLGYYVGHINGVKDHAAGRYVVVTLPNGKDIVSEVKETANDSGKAK